MYLNYTKFIRIQDDYNKEWEYVEEQNHDDIVCINEKYLLEGNEKDKIIKIIKLKSKGKLYDLNIEIMDFSLKLKKNNN